MIEDKKAAAVKTNSAIAETEQDNDAQKLHRTAVFELDRVEEIADPMPAKTHSKANQKFRPKRPGDAPA